MREGGGGRKEGGWGGEGAHRGAGQHEAVGKPLRTGKKKRQGAVEGGREEEERGRVVSQAFCSYLSSTCRHVDAG